MIDAQQKPPKEIPAYLKVFGVMLVIRLGYLGFLFPLGAKAAVGGEGGPAEG